MCTSRRSSPWHGVSVRGPKSREHRIGARAYCPDCDLKLPRTKSGFSTCELCGVEFEVLPDGAVRRQE